MRVLLRFLTGLILCSSFDGWGIKNADTTALSAESSVCSNSLVMDQDVQKACQFPGPACEEKLKRLLKVDVHYTKALYYLNQETSGFMAQERFERAHDRGIADIREASTLKDDEARFKAALAARSSWLEGLRRARFRDKPVK